ncbi:lytic transglycosylase domain-containing protein [Moraxella oblonga]|uniref:lytic transglycosylase domain-containing protein n=1 Tax=Moraxella oblonga TaxID=200413 RepID=UPI00083148D4|nr:lytic transglycosylase domain-containing protein [Moraxella oblonga]
MKKTPYLLVAMLFSQVAFAGNVYVYKDNNGQNFLTNVQQNTSGTNKFTQVSVTYYPDTKLHSAGDIPVTYNPTTSATPSSSANRDRYDHLIRSAAMRHGVDPALVKAIIHTESAFNPNARSPVGAMGLMQLMPGTARDMGVANAWDPAQNIEGGVKYLAWLQRQFTNRNHVIAAYNAGHGNVKKYGGIPPFRETQNYVRSVSNRYATLYVYDANIRINNHTTQLAMNQQQPIQTQPVVYGNYNNQNFATPQNPSISNNAGRIHISR